MPFADELGGLKPTPEFGVSVNPMPTTLLRLPTKIWKPNGIYAAVYFFCFELVISCKKSQNNLIICENSEFLFRENMWWAAAHLMSYLQEVF